MAAFNQCVDPDIDPWVDFGSAPSPTLASSASRLPVSSASSATTSPATTLLPLDQAEDHQTPAKPSHEYERWKQQTGLPSNSVPGLQSHSSLGPFSNSGLSFDDMGGMGDSGLESGWNSGLGMGADVNMELDLTSPGTSLPAYFFPTGENSQSDDFVNPSAIQQEESTPNVRVWPGMHQQQAALVKAQQQAAQQRQQQIIQRQQQRQQQKKAAEQQGRMHHSRRSASNQITDARTEETITRVVNQIRQSSQLTSSADGVSPTGSVLPQIVKMKKDEEEMDEDERLLASEEGKKLSSKERRQLRNKVSARAFRSRRKEYIGQLEGEVALKSNECNELRNQNRALMDENMRYRNFTEKLLRHPAFQPFLEDLSRDPALSEQMVPPPMQAQLPSVPSQNASVTAGQEAKPAFGMAQQQIQNPRIGMALVPETQVDLSSLNLDNNWAMSNIGFNFQQPQVYAVLELPEGPANPIDTEFLSGKSSSYEETPSPVEEEKADYPVIERPVVEEAQAPAVEEPSEEELNDPDFALYVNAPAPSAAAAAPAGSQPLFGDIAPEKAFAHFELFVSSDVGESESQRLMEQFERTCARIEPVFQRLQNMTSFLDL